MSTKDKGTDRKNNKEFARELEKRTKRFGVRIVRLSTKLPNTPEGRVVRYQMTKAGTSVGANYREANRARSKADFRNKINICETEASETQYWLEMIVHVGWLTREDLNWEYEECGELLAIFTSIGEQITALFLFFITLVTLGTLVHFRHLGSREKLRTGTIRT